MNDMTIHGGSAVTMTSLELVEFINSQRGEGDAELRHADFLTKVPKVLGKDAGNFSFIYLDSMNRQKPCYTFPKREACLMAMSYSYDLQAKVFDRMTALEAHPIDPMQVLSDPAAMRGLLLTYTEKVLTLESKVQELKPKAEFHDQVVVAPDAISIAEAAKIIGTGRNRLLSFLRQHGWVTRKNEPYQAKIESGHMDVKLSPWEHPTQGLQRSVTPLITGKGLTELQHIHRSTAA